MTNEENHTAYFVFPLITIIPGSLASIISIIIFVIIIYHQYNNQVKRQDRITLILCANIYLFIFFSTIILIPVNIQTLLGDLYGQDFNSSICIYHEYFICVMICSLYYGFVIQALHRLGRIVYSPYRWLQVFWFYVIVAPIQFTVSCVLLCPLLIWQDIIYVPNDYYCFVSLTHIRGTLWMTAIIYGFPIFGLSVIYIRIMRFIHQQSGNQTTVIKCRQVRDFLVVQRIIFLVGLLFILGVPSIILMIIYFVTGYVHPLYYRITWFSYEISMVALSVLIVFMTPQLKSIVMKRWQRNRVVSMNVALVESIHTRAGGTLRPIQTLVMTRLNS